MRGRSHTGKGFPGNASKGRIQNLRAGRKNGIQQFTQNRGCIDSCGKINAGGHYNQGRCLNYEPPVLVGRSFAAIIFLAYLMGCVRWS